MERKHGTEIDLRRLRRILWAAQLASVAIVVGLAWWLPDLVPIQSVPGAQFPVLIVGILAVAVVFLLERRLGNRERRPDPRLHPQASTEAGVRAERGRFGRYVLIIALADAPAIFGLVYVLVGGAPSHALILAAGSLLLLLSFRPD